MHAMVRRPLRWLSLSTLVMMAGIGVAPASAQTRAVRPTGRVSFYTNLSQLKPVDGASVVSGDFITNASYMLPDTDGNGMEFGMDVRHADYTDRRRATRVSVYDGYVGGRFANGHVRIRAGQMWLNDLGGLGSVAGGVVEFKQGPASGGLGGSESARSRAWNRRHTSSATFGTFVSSAGTPRSKGPRAGATSSATCGSTTAASSNGRW